MIKEIIVPSTKAEADIELFEATTEEIEVAYMQARFLKAFADPTRLRILRLLQKSEGTMCVAKIVEALGSHEQPTISHHLRILRQAGIVSAKKHGLFAYYTVRRDVAMRQAQLLIASGGGIDER